ncbi:hypothetical protein ACIBCT_39750 [Streptosporangium sp. NPDC050855]|uniref:hypothetical protein n=1 Tax=Streptosporangium sp. NPDC050855 TaxID=3366194 RepID=UPI003797A0B4
MPVTHLLAEILQRGYTASANLLVRYLNQGRADPDRTLPSPRRLLSWLNAGVSPKQVAEWAGNSVEVLHRTYEKCLVGHDEIAMRRISDVLRPGPREPIGKDQPETADDSRTRPDAGT